MNRIIASRATIGIDGIGYISIELENGTVHEDIEFHEKDNFIAVNLMLQNDRVYHYLSNGMDTFTSVIVNDNFNNSDEIFSDSLNT